MPTTGAAISRPQGTRETDGLDNASCYEYNALGLVATLTDLASTHPNRPCAVAWSDRIGYSALRRSFYPCCSVKRNNSIEGAARIWLPYESRSSSVCFAAVSLPIIGKSKRSPHRRVKTKSDSDLRQNTLLCLDEPLQFVAIVRHARLHFRCIPRHFCDMHTSASGQDIHFLRSAALTCKAASL